MLEEAPLRTQGIQGLAHDHQVLQLIVGFPMVSLMKRFSIRDIHRFLALYDRCRSYAIAWKRNSASTSEVLPTCSFRLLMNLLWILLKDILWGTEWWLDPQSGGMLRYRQRSSPSSASSEQVSIGSMSWNIDVVHMREPGNVTPLATILTIIAALQERTQNIFL